MKSPTGNPCRECPFRRKSLAGYVGATTPEEFLASSHSAAEPMPCHMEVNYERKDWQAQAKKVHQCSGHAIYLENVCKVPRTDDVKTLPADKELVFGNGYAFLEHHGGDPVEWMKMMLPPGVKISKTYAAYVRKQAKALARK